MNQHASRAAILKFSGRSYAPLNETMKGSIVEGTAKYTMAKKPGAWNPVHSGPVRRLGPPARLAVLRVVARHEGQLPP